MRPDWWTWQTAVLAAAPSSGVVATAMVWANECWSWQQLPTEDIDRARPMHLEKLVKAYPYAVGYSTVKRHLATLVELELLEVIRGHSPHGANTYAPTLNTAHQRALYPLLHGSPVSPVPVNTAHQRALLNTHTAHQRALLDPDTVSPLADPPTRALARARQRPEGTGGTRDPLGIETLDQLARAMDRRYGFGTSSRLTSGWQWRAIDALGKLRGAGWPADVLVDRLNAREWSTSGSLGRVLMSRLEDLAEEPPPTTAAQRAAARRAEAAVGPCDHGTPGGCGRCHLCRRGSADEDGVTCAQCAHDALTPPGFTPALFPTGSPDPPTDSPQ